MFSGEETNNNFIVFVLTSQGTETTICCTGGKHANNYTTDAVHHIQTNKERNTVSVTEIEN
jgi:hypothetical protein